MRLPVKLPPPARSILADLALAAITAAAHRGIQLLFEGSTSKEAVGRIGPGHASNDECSA